MSETVECDEYYQRVKSAIESLQAKDADLDRVVVPSEDFDRVKPHADVSQTEDGWPHTSVAGVQVTHLGRVSQPEARIKLTEDGGRDE